MGLFILAAAAAEPKVDIEQASRSAKASVKSGRVERAELIEENGKQVWDVSVRGESGAQDVRVDANCGEVLPSKSETDEATKALDALDKRRAELEKQLQDAQAAGKRKWRSVQPHIQRALEELGRGVDALNRDDKK